MDHQHTIATLWSLSLDQLHALQPAAAQLLELCAYLAPVPIPLNLFTDHPEHLPAPLGHIAGDLLAFAETVGILVDYSLVRRTDDDLLLLHRLVQAVIRQSGAAQLGDPEPLPVVLSLLYTDLPETSRTHRRTGPAVDNCVPMSSSRPRTTTTPTRLPPTQHSHCSPAWPSTSKSAANRLPPDHCWSGPCTSLRPSMDRTTPTSPLP